MCNKVHKHKKDLDWDPKFKKIAQEGVGYKIFLSIKGKTELYTMCGYEYHGSNSRAIDVTTKYAHWDDGKWYGSLKKGDLAGFCFFATRAEAQSAKDSSSIWAHRIVRKIYYKGGIGSFYSPELDRKLRRFRIATSFKVID